MHHSFDTELAERYGILEAVLLENISFWISKNRANGQGYHDGRYWTYNSTRAFSELFPYVSERQIQSALKHLRDEGVIQTANYNAQPYDRTLWYAFTDFGESIIRERKMDLRNDVNANTQEVEPIPDINTDMKTDINTDSNDRKRFTVPTAEEVSAYCKERGNGVDAERFCDFYASKGWKVGNSPMKDWRACVRTWERRDKTRAKHDDSQPTGWAALDDLA